MYDAVTRSILTDAPALAEDGTTAAAVARPRSAPDFGFAAATGLAGAACFGFAAGAGASSSDAGGATTAAACGTATGSAAASDTVPAMAT